MSVAVATMGKYWPQAGYGIAESKGIGGSGIGTIYDEKRKPVIRVTGVDENGHTRRKINIKVTSVTEN